MRRFPCWDELKRVRRLPLATAYATFLIAIPLAVGVRATLKQQFDVVVDVPVHLLMLYLASLSFYVGTVIFDLRCPRIIRDNESRYHFVATCLTHSDRKIKYRQSITDRIDAILKAHAERGRYELPLPEATTIFEETAKLVESDALEDIWERNNADYYWERGAILVLFATAFVITFIVSAIDTPWRVFHSLG